MKKHNAPATFFVVGHFLESAPEMVKRMVEDGHTVGTIPIIIMTCRKFLIQRFSGKRWMT